MAPPAVDPAPDVPPSAPEGEAPADPTPCPKCGGKLTNPEGLGWCPACGYCRSVAEEKEVVAAVAPAPPKKPSALGAAEFSEALRHMPAWAGVLLAGVALVVGASVVADYCLPEEGLARALWSAFQIVLSLVGLVVAQLGAVALSGDRDDGLQARDVVLGARVWRIALRRLPATRKPVWLGAWCLTALVCGAVVIGGFGYWLEVVRGAKVRRLARAAEAAEAAKAAATAKADPGPVAPPAPPPPPPPRPVAQCVVIGYEDDGTRVTGLLLATADGELLKYVGVLKEGITPELGKNLLGQLSRLARDIPLVPGLKVRGVTWVRPGLFCDVTHAGTDKDGRLQKAILKELRD